MCDWLKKVIVFYFDPDRPQIDARATPDRPTLRILARRIRRKRRRRRRRSSSSASSVRDGALYEGKEKLHVDILFDVLAKYCRLPVYRYG
jgi:hypothetical protein